MNGPYLVYQVELVAVVLHGDVELPGLIGSSVFEKSSKNRFWVQNAIFGAKGQRNTGSYPLGTYRKFLGGMVYVLNGNRS